MNLTELPRRAISKLSRSLGQSQALVPTPRSYQPEILESPADDPVIREVARLAGASEAVRVNVGCGTDYREGFINIDGSTTLPRVDRVMDLIGDKLSHVLGENSVDYILAKDIVEHVRHWEATELLRQFYLTLRAGGSVEIHVPDCEYIMQDENFTLEQKLVWLFGGQDKPQGNSVDMDRSRREFPQYFCHGYGWSLRRMGEELTGIGFSRFAFRRNHTNFITYAIK